MIHSTAVIHPKARVGDGCEIGPYCVIGEHVELGTGCKLHSHVVIDGHTTLGARNEIFPFASIGLKTQDLKWKGGITRTEIGDENTFREYVTIHSATSDGEVTKVGSRNHILAYCHLAHNVVLGNNVIMSNVATLAGHVTVEDHAVVGGLAAVHEQVEAGHNFFLVFPEGEDALIRFCHSFNLQPDCLRDRFKRSDLLRMGQYVDGDAFDEMLIAWDADDLVIFLEQIDFPRNRPPHVKPFIVYSPLWGILSQHDDVRAARAWLEDSEQWDRTRLSQPHVYQWSANSWKML